MLATLAVMFLANVRLAVIAIGDITISPIMVILIAGTIIPIISGWATKYSSKLTGPLDLVLTAVAALLATNVTAGGGAVLSKETLYNFVLTLAATLAAYYKVWKPLGVTNNPNNPTGAAKLGADKGLG